MFLSLLVVEPESSHVQYSTTEVNQTSYYKHSFCCGCSLGHQNILLFLPTNTHFQLKFWDRFGYFLVKGGKHTDYLLLITNLYSTQL